MFVIRTATGKQYTEHTTQDLHEVYGTVTGRVMMTGTIDECKKYIARRKQLVARRIKKEVYESLGMTRCKDSAGKEIWE